MANTTSTYIDNYNIDSQHSHQKILIIFGNYNSYKNKNNHSSVRSRIDSSPDSPHIPRVCISMYIGGFYLEKCIDGCL